MHSPALKPISIALCPSADRSTLIPNTHQQHYLSPPLTPFLTHLSPEDHSKHPTSLQSYFPTSLPAIRDMLPPERRPDTVPTEPLNNLVYSASAPERRSQLELTETLDPIPSSITRGTTSIPDPNRLQQVFSSQPLNGIPPSSSMLSPLLRRNKAHVASACVNCKKAHLACDGTSPCVLVRRSPFRLSTVVASRWLSQLLPTPYQWGQTVICAAAAECGCMSSGSCAHCPVLGIFPCGWRIWDRGLCVRGEGSGIGERGMGNYFFNLRLSDLVRPLLKFGHRSCFRKNVLFRGRSLQLRRRSRFLCQWSLVPSQSRPALAFPQDSFAALLFSVGLCADLV